MVSAHNVQFVFRHHHWCMGQFAIGESSANAAIFRLSVLRLVVVSLAALAIVIATVRDCPAEDSDKLRQQMKYHREQLTSGVVEITGIRSVVDPTRSFAANISIHISFDHLAGLQRFDMTEDVDPRWYVVPASPAPFQRSINVRSPAKSMQFSSLHPRPVLWLDYPAVEPRQSNRNERRGLDVRSLGLFSGDGLFDGTSFNELLNMFFTAGGVVDFTVSPVEGSIVEASVFAMQGRARRRLWIDTGGGFTPIRVISEISSLSKETNEFTIWNEKTSGDISWELHSGVYVPTSFQSRWTRLYEPSAEERQQGTPEGEKSQHVIDLKLTWQSVNEGVSADVFEYKNFDLPVGTAVWDNRLKPAELVEYIKAPVVSQTLPARRWSPMWFVFLAALLAFGFLLRPGTTQT